MRNTVAWAMSLGFAVGVTLGAAACDNRNEARVGGALLPQANHTIATMPGATTVVITPGVMPTLPAGPVQLAIDVNVPWSQVRTALTTVPRPPAVVGDFNRRRGFILEDFLDDNPAVIITATAGGKFCLRPPDADLAYCMESSDRRHISAAFVREVMRKAVTEYGITQARIDADDHILWADLVRTIDGARTCCKQPVKVMIIPPS
jgi:hypothetical protein